MTGRGSGCGSLVPKNLSAIAWPVAREVPVGWCTIPTGTLARGMRPWSFSTLAIIPAVFVAPPSGDVRDGVGALSVCL